MSSNVYLSICLLGALFSSSYGQGLSWFNQEESNELDCVGRFQGLYAHPDPERCAAYLACEGGLKAVERSCPIRNGTQLHFSLELRDALEPCDLPERACCHCHKPTTTRKPTTTTTRAPTTPSTTTPTTTSTTTPRTPRPPPPPGKCYPDECKLDGYCDCYEECVSNGDGTGNLVERDCGEDLFWLPNNITGGTCAYFESLPSDIQDRYRNDTTCIPKCEWFQKDEDVCSPRYTYRKPFDNQSNLGREQALSCPAAPPGRKPLYWVQSSLTCDICDNAVDLDGRACNCE